LKHFGPQFEKRSYEQSQLVHLKFTCVTLHKFANLFSISIEAEHLQVY